MGVYDSISPRASNCAAGRELAIKSVPGYEKDIYLKKYCYEMQEGRDMGTYVYV